MQRQGSAIGSFPETIEIDQGSVPNNAGMGQESSFNNLLNPLESRLSNDTASSAEPSFMNAISHNVHRLSGWSSGESSSSLNPQNPVNDDAIKMEERWSSSVNAHTVVGPRSEERQLPFPGRGGIGIGTSQVRSGHLFMQGSSSNHVPQNLNPNAGLMGDVDNERHRTGSILGPNSFISGGLDIERASTSTVSSDDIGTSSGSSGYMVEETSGWGLSCKRKALEGTSGHSYQGGSSNCFQEAENGTWQTDPSHHNACSSLSLSIPTRNSPSGSPPEEVDSRIDFGIRMVTSDAVPTSNSLRNFGRRVNSGHQQESIAFNLPTTGGSRRSNIWSSNLSPRPVPFDNSLHLRSTAAAAGNSSATHGLPPVVHTPSSSTNMHPFLWNGSLNSRAGNPSGSLVPGESAAASQEEVRGVPRNRIELSMFGPPTEVRNIARDPAGWSIATGNTSASSSVRSRAGSSSGTHPSPPPAWVTQHNPTTHNLPRFSDFAPWSLFPPMEAESGQSGHFHAISSTSGASSSREAAVASGSSGQGHGQPFPRFLMEGPGDEVLGMSRSLRALAADIEGRHRLISEIRQVLNAMRRGENLRAEDYMLFDPLIYHGMAEMHDRHRDMRLDVDNMSYEELLALEERIGDVSTGLSEEMILKLMKQHNYVSVTAESSTDVEPCCICQEEYVEGDELGTLDCGHDFHTNCIKQWLMQKNLCPICKMTALLT